MSSHSQSGSDMPPMSWKALTSSRLTSLKDYVAQKEYKSKYDALSSRMLGNRDNGSRQTWDQWARNALGTPSVSPPVIQRVGLGVEKVQLFPGWAVRRYKDPSKVNEDGAEFGLDVFVSGFASTLRPPEVASRSQKAFYRLAKGYAALPKLPAALSSSSSSHERPTFSQGLDIPSDLDLSKLPPRPFEITDDTDLELLEAQFKQTSVSSSPSSAYSSDEDETPISEGTYTLYRDKTPTRPTPFRSASHDLCRTIPVQPKSVSSSSPSSTSSKMLPPQKSYFPETVAGAAQRLHANLDARLQPFWSNAIPNRLVRISIFCPQHGYAPSEAQEAMEGQDTDPEPLAVKDVTTSPEGAFQTTFSVPWERLATHPPTLHIAFGDVDVEYPVVIQAEMWGPPTSSAFSTSIPYSPYLRDNASRSQPQFSSLSSPTSDVSQNPIPPDSGAPSIKNRVTLSLSVPHVPVRLISDIDDTIKHAGVLLGAKNVFRNVFVRQLDELIVHSMVDWYRDLWQKGVRFHYVSNSPYELLPVLTEFFHVSSLPQGSIKLKSYAARSLLPALLSPPAARKRQGVIEVLDNFPKSRFILVGDTGEQDMELYAELARERPNQVVGVFVRDVTTEPGYRFCDGRPAYGSGGGSGSLGALSEGHLVNKEPAPIASMPSMDSLRTESSTWNMQASPYSYSSFSAMASSSTSRLPGMLLQRNSSGGMTTEERRKYELELRIERARAEIPTHTAFRVFREPDECLEMRNILERLLKEKTS
ncbi:hypothetical protein K439DRAFT_1387305 [Ramaria rubella]|nr:hypothetical protein K439DRAFT_1387305 [Ramaria rubella]